MTTFSRIRATGLAALLPVALLAACGEREIILPGQRLDPLAVASPDGPAVIGAPAPASIALSLPAMRANADWTHRAGNAAHDPGHAALGAGMTLQWAASIGSGDARRFRITADPIIWGGMVFTLDSRANVVATSTGGGTIWQTSLRPATERGDSVSGGGISAEGGRIFVTTGYGELVALDARSGGILWRQRVDTAISGAPAVQNGVVYVAARNGVGWAVRAENGRVLWQTNGIGAPMGVMGVSAPAVSGNTVVFPFASGQLLAAETADGMTQFSAQVAGTRTGRAIAAIRDMTGDPVIAGGRLYGGTSSGRITAFDLGTGAEIWSARDGANSPVVVAGGSIFAVNDQAELIRLDAATGGVIWRVALPYYTTERPRRQDRIFASYGPVLAGGRLFVASSDGVLRVFDPASGALTGQAAIPGGAAAAPAVAGQTLYVVSRNGQLLAFR
ncbi:MAG: PQQ-binding-like beta-propeller repeat protein [Paracoccus sp. (in: a-proteobacteria)]|uniref:PQQ-like beta-propeller repeat protein n=1 Tax=Paracoccus sp. TaxID=267 RepID=UPI0026DF5366|nr:PQQ-like beta-propeller repeat protein [Paracoccus sp. (in: a-proteobacteria)]MDO5630870.1 PQQ-binding-like beta-propeller repeat protein [Paracoccus sp. (in: a-proteobacteria)]